MGSIVCCPLCRTPFPREGVSFVPTNFTINRLVEIFRKRKESGKSLAPKELRCGSCETVNLPAVMWCMDCSNSFCVECKDAHNRLKAFKSHATVAVDEFLKNPKLVLSTSEKPEVCRSHVKQALDLYCKTCSSLICRDCTLKDHPRETHDFDFIDDIVDKEREKIKKATAPLEPLLKQVRNGIKRIEKIDKDIDVKSETNRRKIKGVYGEVYKLLKQQQKEALQKVNTIKTSLKKKLAMQKETVKFMESQLVSCMEFSNDAISTNRTRQLLTYKNSIIDRVEILTKQVEHANMDPECRADDMMVRCAKPAEFISDSLCDVSGIPNLPHCGVWGPLAISDPVKVTVSLKDFCGFPVVGQSKDIEIRCNKEVGFLQNVRIEEEANGQYHIWYKPKRKEDHLLFVYWRGLVVNDNMPVNIRSYDNIKEVVKLAKFNFSTPRQHHPKAARAVSSVASPIISVPPKVSLPTFLPSTQVLSLSGSSTSVKSNSEHKQLPMKTDSCLDILKSSKPPVGEKTVEDSTQSKPPAPSSSSSQKFKPAEGSWECPTCMINNKTTDSNCVACTTSRPGGPASTPAASSGLSKGMTLGSGTGLQFGSSGGMKLEAMKDGGMLKVSSTGGFKLGPSSGFNLGSGLKSESTAVGEPATGGFKLEPSGGFKLGVSGGFKLGSSGDLKLGSGGDLKLGSSSDSKVVDKNTINLDSGGKGLKLSSSSALQLGSANSSNLLPSSSIIITTTITSGFTSSSIVSQSLSSRPGSALSTSSAEGNTSAPAPGIKFGGLIGCHSLSSGSSGGDNLKPTLLSGQQSSAQLTLKPLDAGTASTDSSSGLKIGSSSGGLELRTSGGLQLGASGGLKLGASGGLQLGSGGFQSGSSSSGFKLGLPANIQPVSGEAIKLTSGNTSMTHDTEGIELGKKRPIDNVEEEGASNVEPVNKSLLGVPVVLPPLNKPAVATAKSVTFKLDGDNTNSDNVSINKQASFGTPQPSLVAGSGVLTSAGFTLGGSSTGDSKLPSLTNESSATKPFANLFSNSSTTNSSVINFGFPKLTSMSTLATTSASTLQAAPLSGMSSVTTTAADQAKLFNFSQQALFAAPGQGQSGLSGGLDLKLPTCQESKKISGNVTFNFSGAKSNELSQGQQGLSTGLGLTQATSQPGFNFHAAMQNQGGSIFSGSVGSGLSGSSTTNSGLFTDQLGTNQADNASGMEISNPATGEPQHLSNLTGLGGQGLQLQFGNNSNTTQPFIFNSNTNQPNMFEGNSSNVFGVNNSVLGNELPANMIFSASPSIAARPMKKAKRRYPK